MRFALGCLLSASTLFIAAAAGAIGSWALPTSAVLLLVSTVVAAVAMEGANVFTGANDTSTGVLGASQTLHRPD